MCSSCSKIFFTLEYASAIIAPACSCCTQMYDMSFLFEKESTAKAIAPPVRTKTPSTFLSTKKSNKISETFFVLHIFPNFFVYLLNFL